MNSFTDAVLYGKQDLSEFMPFELKQLANYLHIDTRDMTKDDTTWMIAINLLTDAHKKGIMPGVEWEEEVGVMEVPAKEPETREGLKDIKWFDLKFGTVARGCLESIMKAYDVWDIEDLTELIAKLERGDISEQNYGDLLTLKACLRVLKDESTSTDRQRISKYYLARRQSKRLINLQRRRELKEEETKRKEKEAEEEEEED